MAITTACARRGVLIKPMGHDMLKYEIKSLPVMVQEQIEKMDLKKQTMFFDEYDCKKKRWFKAYCLWLFFGLHQAYIRGFGFQIVFWISCLFWVGFIWWIADLFCIPSAIDKHNKGVAIEIMKDIKIIGG